MSNDFIPRLQSTVFPSRRRAVMWQGRLVRPRDAVDVLMFGRPCVDRPDKGYRSAPVARKEKP
jgi:hypothetical protein